MAVTLFLLWVALIRLQWCLLRTLRFWVTVAFPSCSHHHSLPLSLPPPGRKHMTQASMWEIQTSWQLQLQEGIKSHLYCSTLRNNRSGHWLSKTIRLVFIHLHQFNWSDRNTEIKGHHCDSLLINGKYQTKEQSYLIWWRKLQLTGI